MSDDKESSQHHHTSDDDNDDEHHEKKRRHKNSRRKKSHRKESSRRRSRSKHRRRRHGRRSRSSSSESSSSSSSSSSSNQSSASSSDSNLGQNKKRKTTTVSVLNPKLAAKLAKRGETLEDRVARRRAERIANQFGYTNEENPFRDDNLSAPFLWKKKKTGVDQNEMNKVNFDDKRTMGEIHKVRARRQEREDELVERERLRAEESRLREMQHYDDWQQKEEEFHLQQQRQRSALRLTQGRERPVDVLAKNLLMFGLTEEERELNKSKISVKYQEKYNVLEALSNLEAELAEPYVLMKDLKMNELLELESDINEFRSLEAEANPNGGQNTNKEYWDALQKVCQDEIRFLQTGGNGGAHDLVSQDIHQLFNGKTTRALSQLQEEIQNKIQSQATSIDTDYWCTVLQQLDVYRAKAALKEMHSMMLQRQLEHIENKTRNFVSDFKSKTQYDSIETPSKLDESEVDKDNVLCESDEVDLGDTPYKWQGNEKYRPRKPRYFNRVKTGYDWNKYNQTHFDHDNPPPKIVQGYRFDVFYPDLVDKTKTPQYFLERADTDEYCIIRFSAGAPYEDIAFKIVNREWNKSRKRGFRCVFERGVLSLHFNFNTHWYRR